jgi:hypothetical protein
MIQGMDQLDKCKEQCPDIDFERLQIDSLAANLSLIDEMVADAFSS